VSVEDELPLDMSGAARDYPVLAFNAGIRGLVVLEVSTDAAGTVTEARALNDSPLFSHAAVAHAKTWRVRTTTPRRGLIVYEFSTDLRICTKEIPTALTYVTGDYLRLSACGRTIDY
jgi:TonB family protein